jgi:homoserine O-acetyltransferase/O-succinyltransferase
MPVCSEFEVRLPDFVLEAGAPLRTLTMRGWVSAPDGDVGIPGAWLQRVEVRQHSREQVVRRGPQTVVPDAAVQLSSSVPTVLVVHALTGDHRVGGEGGWWSEVCGPGLPLDTTRFRVLCFNNLGSCYGSTGPADTDFPTRNEEPEPRVAPGTRGAWAQRTDDVPATVTTWDQAHAILSALDALGLTSIHAVIGGSVGGMITLCLAMLAPERFQRVIPIAASENASPWIIGFNHVARQTLLADPGYPHNAERGLALARQLAHMTYRAEEGLTQRQGRRRVPGYGHDAPQQPYLVQTYLEYQGDRLVQRYDARAYISQLDAMDHHDMWRQPPHLTSVEPWDLRRLQGRFLCIGIDSDALYLPLHMETLAQQLQDVGLESEYVELRSKHGHDGFLIEFDQLKPILFRALQ